jgi:glycosyltransferase involved in cell wall biosynthesis
LNILFIISTLKHGGAEKQTVVDANLFAEKHNVFIIVFKTGELKELLSNKVKLIVLNKNGYLKTAKKIKKIIIDENIQVINSSLFASMIISVLSAYKINIPVIWFFHSHEYDIKLKSKIAFRYFSKYDCLKKIFFVSKELKQSFEKNGFKFPVFKQDVLYNTYSVNIKKQKTKSEPSKEVTIGYIGRLIKLKRVEYLIDAAGYLKNNNIMNFKIIIIGDGELKNQLINYTRQHNANDKVNILGYKSNVDEYYENFDIFALPSREECLSLALIDACIYSLPCLAFNAGGNNEIIVNGETGYIVDSKKEFCEKLKMLILDENKRKEMGKTANIYCINKFNREKRLEYLEDVFQNLNKIYADE